MHPSFTVVFFTVASGAGYGLLALLGLFAAMGALPGDRALGAAGTGLALALVSAGLLSSTAHLGRPERTWRAFSQWRSSWLSREGVAAVLTFVPALLFAGGWVLAGRNGGWIAAAGLISAAGGAATVAATGMIYASLKPIAQWHSLFTLPAYLIFAVMTGAVLFNAILHLFGSAIPATGIVAAAAAIIGWAWKAATWQHNDAIRSPTTLNSATGLSGGTIRLIEWPHTEENYILKEMGYRIARKHVDKLRRLVHLLAFAVPLALTLAALATDGELAAVLAVAAAIVQAPGMLIERWLFFAEAKHTAVLYYSR